MNITPETIAEMAASVIEMTPQQAVGYLDDVSKKFSGNRADHDVLKSALRLLQTIVREHANLTAAEVKRRDEATAAAAVAAAAVAAATDGAGPKGAAL